MIIKGAGVGGYALEDADNGVFGTDDKWHTTQLIEFNGAKPRLWRTAAEAEFFAREVLGIRRVKAVPVDVDGQALT
jgi:hypothetical protein